MGYDGITQAYFWEVGRDSGLVTARCCRPNAIERDEIERFNDPMSFW